jgi:triosephosphate isomerase
MRKPLIVGNWKMNKTLPESIKLVNDMLAEIDRVKKVEKVICPSFIALAAIGELIRGSSVNLGAQNIYFEEKGAYTGEVSAIMIKDICQYVIIGHSERRNYFCETDEAVNKKIATALKFGLKPILCVGESFEENQADKTKEVITGQVRLALERIDIPLDMVIAYEPIWAIGSGQAASSKQANTSASFIRETVSQLAGKEKARGLRVLYGGSVTAENIKNFVGCEDIDGALVGGACLKAETFTQIIKNTATL